MAAKKDNPSPEDAQNAVVARNKKARFKYELLERFEAGLVLKGSEIKSIRNGEATLDQSFVRLVRGEPYVVGMNITPYDKAGYVNHEPLRPRKLLLHRREIAKLAGELSQAGRTVVPVTLFLKRGLAKLEIAVARGKQQHDKRESIKRRDAQRQIDRSLARRR